MFSHPLSAEKFAAYRNQRKEKRKKIEINDYQFYLDQLNELEDKFNRLHNYVLDYPVPVVVSNMQAIKELESAINYYDVVKAELAKVIPATEIEKIEQSVIKYALEDDTFKNLLFIPEFQSGYQKTCEDLTKERNNKVLSLNTDRARIFVNWKVRDEKYDHIGPNLFCASIFLIGIPFLLGKALAGLVDEIITKIRLAVKDSQIADAKKKCEDGIKKAQSDAEKEIKDSQSLTLKQKFLELSLFRHSKAVEKADERINPRLAPKQSA